MKGLALVAVALVLGCGDGLSGSGADDEVIDRMQVRDPAPVVAKAYSIPEHWQAFNGAGNELALVDSLGLAYPLRVGLADSLPGSSIAVPLSGIVTLPDGFTGRVYVFAPTARASRENMGFHFITVAEPFVPWHAR